MELNNHKLNYANNLFRAIDVIVPMKLHLEDTKYLLFQLALHYYYRYKYFRYMDATNKGEFDEAKARVVNIKSITAKKNVIAFIEKHNGFKSSIILNNIFGHNNWEHVITDGSINYEH